MTALEQNNLTREGQAELDASSRLFTAAEYNERQDRSLHPIDRNARTCEANAKSNFDTAKCGDLARTAWDKELNKAYQSFRKDLDPEQKEALRQSELQWIKFRDAEFDSIEQIYTNQGSGSETIPWAAFAKADIVKERAVELQNRNSDNSNGSIGERINVGNCNMLYVDCLGLSLDNADDRLNLNYKALMSNLNQSGKEALRNSEREWIKYRDAEFEMLDKYFDSRYSGNRIENLQAKLDIVMKRAERLQHQLDIVSKGF